MLRGADPQRICRKNIDDSLLETSRTEKTGISISFTNEKDRSFLTYRGTNAGISIDKIDLWYDGVEVLKKGQPVDANKPLWREIVAKKTFTITMNLNMGSASEAILAADLTEEYVNFNKGE